MIISGLQKMTLLDYPGRVACTVFLQGCNFRCPFCHNSDLLGAEQSAVLTEGDLLRFLEGRRGLLDAVCVSGGEPTLQPDLEDLLRRIKAMGYLVKLDTNGSRPRVLEWLLRENLLDYVAMDVKNSPLCYGETVGLDLPPLPALEDSLRLLLTGQVAYELRTTVVAELHDAASVEEMGAWVAGLAAPVKPAFWYLQPFVDRDSVLMSGLHAPTAEQLAQYAERLAPFAGQVAVRGM